MQRFIIQHDRRRVFMLLLFLMMFSCCSYGQTLPEGVTEAEEKGYVQSANPENTSDASPASIRLLKKEKRKMKKLSKFWKSRASRTNASLSALEANSQKSTDRLVESLSNHIDSLRAVKNQQKGDRRKAKVQLNDVKHAALPNVPLTSHSLTEKVQVPGIAQAVKATELESMPPLHHFNQYKFDSMSVDKIVTSLIQKTPYGQIVEKLEGTQALLQQTPSNLLDTEVKALQNKEQLQRYAQAKAAKLATVELAKMAPHIQEAQQKFTQYKKKKDWLQEGSGEKANSLKDQSFSERIVYGGNVQMAALAPFSLVAAPFVGYRINKKVSAGISISYQSILGNNTSAIKSFGGEVGYRGFVDYKLIKHWFAHGELERMSKTVNNVTKEGYDTHWQTNGYVGIGRSIGSIQGLKLSAILLCNITHKDLQSLNPAAFQFRIGLSK